MSRYIEELQRHQARIDAVKRSMPASPVGEPVTDLTQLEAPAKAAREAIAAAQADVDAAQAELTRAKTAHDKATQNVNDLRGRAWVGELVDPKKLSKELDVLARIDAEIELINVAVDYRQRIFRETSNKLIALAVAANWHTLSLKRERAALNIQRRIDAELAEKMAIEQFETARFIYHEGFRSYLEADMVLAKVAL